MTKARILYIQEPHDCCRLYRAILKAAGYTFVSAANLMQARELIQTQQFHLYVIASVVNGSSAVELCEWLREGDLHTPIVFIGGPASTPKGSAQTQRRARHAGADAYLVTPLDSDTLIGTVAKLLGGKELGGKELRRRGCRAAPGIRKRRRDVSS